eukprot:jgi/Botrbrau1/14440/Bobra.0014s0086.1
MSPGFWVSPSAMVKLGLSLLAMPLTKAGGYRASFVSERRRIDASSQPMTD